MGKSKTEHFSEETNALSAIGKCISHPARIAIIEFLLKSESCVCGDIVANLPLSQSTVSQHLKELKSIGLIKGEISGPSVRLFSSSAVVAIQLNGDLISCATKLRNSVFASFDLLATR